MDELTSTRPPRPFVKADAEQIVMKELSRSLLAVEDLEARLATDVNSGLSASGTCFRSKAPKNGLRADASTEESFAVQICSTPRP